MFEPMESPLISCEDTSECCSEDGLFFGVFRADPATIGASLVRPITPFLADIDEDNEIVIERRCCGRTFNQDYIQEGIEGNGQQFSQAFSPGYSQNFSIRESPPSGIAVERVYSPTICVF